MTPPSAADGRPGEDAEAAAEPVGTEDVEAGPSPDDETEVEPAWVRRRRLDAVFSDGAHGQALGDRYYRDQVPPHHG